MAEQAALRRVATAVAASTDPRRVFSVVTEEVARLLGAQSSNMVRFNPGRHGDGDGRLERSRRSRNIPVGDTVAMDGDTASARVYRTGAPARIDNYADLDGALAERLRGLGFVSAVAGPIFLDGRLWGAVIVSSVEPEPPPAGAEQRIADFAELAAQALANAESRAAAGRVARPHRGGGRRRAPAPGAQPARRRAAAARLARADAADGGAPASRRPGPRRRRARS